MSQPTRQEILSRLAALRTERETFRAHWAEITQYLLPRNGRYFVQDRDRGFRRHNNIFDNTATRALNTLAAGMMSGMTSPARPWFRFGTVDPDRQKSQAAKLWLNQATQITLDIFARGNTYRALHAIYKELGAFGTACSLVLDDYNDVMRQYNLTCGEYFIAQDWRGQVCTVYREFQKTIGEVVAEFGRDRCSNATRSLYDRGQLDKWITIYQAIEPREDREPGKPGALNMAWRSVYLEQGGNGDDVLRESGFKYFPALAPRWDLAGGDIYGNSPGMDALGDIKQLQQEQLRKSQGIDYMTKPPLQMPSGMKNREIDALPGGISYLDSTGAPGIRNLFQVQLDLQHLLGDVQDVRERINSTFYADLFLMMANDSRSGITATEVAERQEEKLLMLGPVLERLNNELLSPLVEMAFTRAIEHGLLPPPPAELQGQDLNVEFVSMLAQAQRAVGTTTMDRYVQAIGAVASVAGPAILDNFDPDKYADVYADMLGVDPEIIVPGDKVALIRKQRAQAQAEAQRTAMLNQQADTAQKLANAPTKGGGSNALNDIINQYQGYGAPDQVNAQPGQ